MRRSTGKDVIQLAWICAAAAMLAVPASSAAAKPQPNSSPSNYFHAAAMRGAALGENVSSAGGSVTHHAPVVTDDGHSHSSIAVINDDGDGKRDIVEAGWMMRRGQEKPRLYVAHYVNGAGFLEDGVVRHSGGGAFVSLSGPLPGASLPDDGAPREFAFEHLTTDPTAPGSTCCPGWYLRYDGKWIGYFPDKLWETTQKRGKTVATTPSDFTVGNIVHWFGEVASPSTRPCTDMGNGLHAVDPRAASFGGLSVNGEAYNPGASYVVTNAALYSTAPLSVTPLGGFRFGGPGAAC